MSTYANQIGPVTVVVPIDAPIAPQMALLPDVFEYRFETSRYRVLRWRPDKLSPGDEKAIEANTLATSGRRRGGDPGL